MYYYIMYKYKKYKQKINNVIGGNFGIEHNGYLFHVFKELDQEGKETNIIIIKQYKGGEFIDFNMYVHIIETHENCAYVNYINGGELFNGNFLLILIDKIAIKFKWDYVELIDESRDYNTKSKCLLDDKYNFELSILYGLLHGGKSWYENHGYDYDEDSDRYIELNGLYNTLFEILTPMITEHRDRDADDDADEDIEMDDINYEEILNFCAYYHGKTLTQLYSEFYKMYNMQIQYIFEQCEFLRILVSIITLLSPTYDMHMTKHFK